MQATTVKIENPLLNELKKIMPKEESLSSFIRKVLEQDLQRRKMIQAAENYAHFLASNPLEEKWLEEWEKADLTKHSAPSKKRKRKGQ